MFKNSQITLHTARFARAILPALILCAASIGSAATPVESSLSADTLARICSDGTCALILHEETPFDTDAQLSSLNALSVLADAAVISDIGASADATMSIDTSFSSASSGSLGFFGDVGVRKPTVSSTHACLATNNTSEGFSYTFVSSADGLLTIDYALDCTPTGDLNFCGGQLEFFLDGLRLPVFSGVSTADPSLTGTATRPITLGATHTLQIQPKLGSVGGGTGCSTPGGFSWSMTGTASWSFDAAPAPIASHTFSGRAVADPTLVSGVVPADVQAFLDAQNIDGAWFAASFSFDASTLDSDPTPESAEYRNAIIDSDLSFGPLHHETIEYCAGEFLDCSIFVENDLPLFGSLRDQYVLRARNLRVLGVPQVLIPGTGVLLDAFNVNASFVMKAEQFSTSPAPSLLLETGIDPDLEALFGPGTHDIVIAYFGTGPAGSYSVGYRVETPFFVPEPAGSVWVMMAFFAFALFRHSRPAPTPS